MEDREQELDQYINMDYVWILFGFCSNFKCLADHPVVAVFQVRLRRRFATFVAGFTCWPFVWGPLMIFCIE